MKELVPIAIQLRMMGHAPSFVLAATGLQVDIESPVDPARWRAWRDAHPAKAREVRNVAARAFRRAV